MNHSVSLISEFRVRTATQPITRYPQPLHFRRQLHRSIIPGLFAVVAFGYFSYQIPAGRWVSVIFLGLSLALCAALHGGLNLDRHGMKWYMLRPKWRYRMVPWQAVIDIRKSLFGLHQPIRLIVKHDRYEPWMWGNAQPDQQMEIEIWTNGYTGGAAIWDAIHEYREAFQRGMFEEIEHQIAHGPV